LLDGSFQFARLRDVSEQQSALIGEHINLIDRDRPDDECDVTYLLASGGAAWRAGGAQVGVMMPGRNELVAGN
jgi:hypothetical protein